MHLLYEYQNGAFTEEEFENLKDYIEISFLTLIFHKKLWNFKTKFARGGKWGRN